MTSSHLTAVLAARNLSAWLPGDSGRIQVLNDVSLDVASSEILDITGPSGAGKSTLLRALARLLPESSGELSLGGEPADRFTPQQWRCKVVLLPQKPAIVVGTVRENLLLPWTLKARSSAERPKDPDLATALGRVALGEVALDRDAARLSVGQQARVALVRVLLTRPPVLLLDEPDAALDDVSAESVRTVLGAFASEGGAVVRVRHRGDDALAPRRFRLRAGLLEEVER